MTSNKWRRVVVGEVILISIIFFIIFSVKLIPSKIATEDNGGIQTYFPKIGERTFLSGKILARYNNLNRIDILFKNPNLESRDEVKIAIKDGQRIVVEKDFTGFNFGDTSRARVDFEPLANSKNSSYTVVVKTTKIVDGKLAIGIKGDNLDMVVYYKPKFDISNSFKETLIVLLNIIFNQPLVLILPLILWGWWLW